jgi:hypothetical protein
MANWKRATESDGTSVDINVDNVAFMNRRGGTTSIYFIGGRSDSGSAPSLSVKETPDEIHLGKPVRSISS